MHLDFEKPLVEIKQRIAELEHLQNENGVDLTSDIKDLNKEFDKLQKKIRKSMTRWQRVQLARHPDRPYTLDYIEYLMEDFVELHGDRYFGDDNAIVAGFAKFNGRNVAVIGQQKGRETNDRIKRNFSMMHPEGYRKALRIMKLAEKYELPILIFVDTIGAYPGVGAEERGQAEAIAKNLMEMSRLRVPILITIIGEGASGGALGIGLGDKIMMLENAWYSVISPEGCAAILWRDRKEASKAAEALKLTATDLLDLEMIDEIIPEPSGGAHWDHKEASEIIKKHLIAAFEEVDKSDISTLLDNRYLKYRKMGTFNVL